jgi:hypothetical protein
MFTHGIQPEDADAVFGDSEQVTKQKEQFVLYVWLNEWKGKQQKGALYSLLAPSIMPRCPLYSALILRTIGAWDNPWELAPGQWSSVPRRLCFRWNSWRTAKF